jgi:hypothetical protein
VDNRIRVDNLVIDIVLQSWVVGICALYPDRHWIKPGDVVAFVWAVGQTRYWGGWICALCLLHLPPEPRRCIR